MNHVFYLHYKIIVGISIVYELQDESIVINCKLYNTKILINYRLMNVHT